MRHSAALVLALTASAAAYSPGEEESWTPARQTDSSYDHELHMAQGRSPVPTEGPKGVFGRMDLQPRLDGYTLGPLTCGFVSSNGNSLVCLSSTTDTCAYVSGYMGCCEPNKDCSRIKTRCINYSQSKAGLCTSLTDYHTVCCNINSPACYTYTMTFSGGAGTKTGTFTALDCSPTAGSGKLLDYDPSWSKTHSFPSSTSTSTTTTAPPETTTPGGGGGSSTNVGAIAGGTVGGVAALALVGVGAFLLLRKKKTKGSDTSSPPVAMAQTQPQQPPPQDFSGSPQQGFQTYPQQGYNQNTQSVYDPHMSMYSQQTPYSPQQQQGYPQFQQQQPQQQPQQYNQFPQQQGYNYPSNTGSYAGSPPPQTTPSPMVDGADRTATSPHPTSPGGTENAHQQAPTELAVQHPVGNEHNRAELGSS